jgi:hypothetical protein
VRHLRLMVRTAFRKHTLAVIQCRDGRRVKGYCHQRGLPWGDSLAKSVCGEQEYYEDLIRFYRSSLRVRWGLRWTLVEQCSAR